jgi:hypothetical protein
MANTNQTHTDQRDEDPRSPRDSSGLPWGAPRRARTRIDFGPPPIQSSAPPCSIIGSEPKLRGGGMIDLPA